MTIEDLITRLSALDPKTRVYTKRDYTGELTQLWDVNIRIENGTAVVVLD